MASPGQMLGYLIISFMFLAIVGIITLVELITGTTKKESKVGWGHLIFNVIIAFIFFTTIMASTELYRYIMLFMIVSLTILKIIFTHRYHYRYFKYSILIYGVITFCYGYLILFQVINNI